MKTFNISIKVVSIGQIAVEADSYEEAAEKADLKAYWLYQGGNQLTDKSLNFTDCEIEVDHFEVDLDSPREEI